MQAMPIPTPPLPIQLICSGNTTTMALGSSSFVTSSSKFNSSAKPGKDADETLMLHAVRTRRNPFVFIADFFTYRHSIQSRTPGTPFIPFKASLCLAGAVCPSLLPSLCTPMLMRLCPLQMDRENLCSWTVRVRPVAS
jgi:hypothetical protein